MNCLSIIVSNPAYLEAVAEVDHGDACEIDPTDLTPLISRFAPMVTATASEDGEVAEVKEKVQDGNIPALVMYHSSSDEENIENWLLRMSNELGDTFNLGNYGLHRLVVKLGFEN